LFLVGVAAFAAGFAWEIFWGGVVAILGSIYIWLFTFGISRSIPAWQRHLSDSRKNIKNICRKLALILPPWGVFISMALMRCSGQEFGWSALVVLIGVAMFAFGFAHILLLASDLLFKFSDISCSTWPLGQLSRLSYPRSPIRPVNLSLEVPHAPPRFHLA
jgi:hypothetical protein